MKEEASPKEEARHEGSRLQWRHFVSLAIILAVFGLVALLVLVGYEPAVATAAASTAGLVASTLLHQVGDRGQRLSSEERP
jgi:uncharacterized membrane protein HdeD (DUF308 family)